MADPLRRIDIRFTLARFPRTASVLGDIDAWRPALALSEIELLSPGKEVDLVVADGSGAARAFALPAAEVVVEGQLPRGVTDSSRPDRQLQRRLINGYPESPGVIVDPDQRRPTQFALRNLVSAGSQARALRNHVASQLAGRGWLPANLAPVTVATSVNRPPALVALAEELGGPPASGWCLTLSDWSGSRSAFLLFAAGARRPDRVLKFSRERGWDHVFEEDECAMAMVERVGGAVAARATKFLGRADFEGRHVLLETAAPGVPLSVALRRSPRRQRHTIVSAIADWVTQVGTETAAPFDALGSERDRLARIAADQGTHRDVVAAVLDALGPVPAVLRHGDLWGGHIFVDGDDFTVIDWNSAVRHGFPLWDLIHFGVNILGVVEGVKGDKSQASFLLDLFLGRAASSDVFFGWIRSYVRALCLDKDAVAPLVTLYWLDRLLWVHGEGAEYGPPGWVRTSAEAWMTEDGLGARWNRWLQ